MKKKLIKLNTLQWIYNQCKSIVPWTLIIIIIGAAVSAFDICRSLFLKEIINSAIESDNSAMIFYLILMAIIILSSIILQGLSSVITSKISAVITNELQKNFYKKLISSKWMELSKYHSGDLMTRITSDIEGISSFVTVTIPSIISLTVLLIGSFAVLTYLAPTLAIISLIISPLLLLTSKFYGNFIKKLYIKGQKLESRYRAFLNESFQNIVIIKTFNSEKNSLLSLSELQHKKMTNTVNRSKVSAMSNTFFSFFTWLGFFIVIFWGGTQISKGLLTYGTLSALLSLFGNIQGPLTALATAFPKFISAIASAERLMELYKMGEDICESQLPATPEVNITISNVHVAYENETTILKDISINIPQGETVAVTGSSGEGKTTFVRMLLALIEKQKGYAAITSSLYTQDINGSTRKFISYVPQGNTLFSGTVIENIRFANINATEYEVRLAAETACALQFIEELPNGFHTRIGEKGIGLSEGQAQRISLARAILRKSPILILDEATSALDSQTEMKVLENIDKLDPKPTCIIITHRPKALEICNRIFKIENGLLLEN